MTPKHRPATATAASPARRPSASPPARKRHILLVDDHPMTREGLAANINRQADLIVCGEAGSPAEAMSALAKSKPDLLLTDLTMPGRSGLEFLKDVVALVPGLPVIVLSMHDEAHVAERALRAGARAYLMKDAGAAKVIEVIRRVLNGESYVSPALTSRMLGDLIARRPRGSHSPIATLTDREFEVYQLLGSGKSTKEVAAALGLSPKTVGVHRARIKAKLGLKDAPSLVHHAVLWMQTQAVRV